MNIEYEKILIDLLQNQGGFTFRVSEEFGLGEVKSGFSVSTFKNFESITPLSNPMLTTALFDVYMVACAGKPSIAFGGWVDDGKVYLDISTIVQDKEEALELAKLNEQIAIFDLAKKETIYL